MGLVTDFLKIFGFWFPEKGTVFGGPEGEGLVGKIVFTAPYRPRRPEPPVIPPHQEGQQPPGHYPMTIDGRRSVYPQPYARSERAYRDGQSCY